LAWNRRLRPAIVCQIWPRLNVVCKLCSWVYSGMQRWTPIGDIDHQNGLHCTPATICLCASGSSVTCRILFYCQLITLIVSPSFSLSLKIITRHRRRWGSIACCLGVANSFPRQNYVLIKVNVCRFYYLKFCSYTS